MRRWIDDVPGNPVDDEADPEDFTLKACLDLQAFLHRDDFPVRDSRMIFEYLQHREAFIPFCLYLKRYIYLRTDMRVPFDHVVEPVYKKYIIESFLSTGTPKSFFATTTPLSVLVKGWLNAAAVNRESIFLLGFALSMETAEVSEFLTKANRDRDFDPGEPLDVICRYCFQKHLTAGYAHSMFKTYWQVREGEKKRNGFVRIAGKNGLVENDTRAESAGKSAMSKLNNDGDVFSWLDRISESIQPVSARETAFQWFCVLLENIKSRIAEISAQEDVFALGDTVKKRAVRDADVEKILYSSTPVTAEGNLLTASRTRASRNLGQYRLTRQRISRLLRRKGNVNRFDLITLQFLLISLQEEDEPHRRYTNYVRDTENMLQECSLGGLNISNTYEACILSCLLTREPLGTFSEVWEYSLQFAENRR